MGECCGNAAQPTSFGHQKSQNNNLEEVNSETNPHYYISSRIPVTSYLICSMLCFRINISHLKFGKPSQNWKDVRPASISLKIIIGSKKLYLQLSISEI
jgi:hypothetical protein